MPRSKNARLFYRAAKQRLADAAFLMEHGRTTAAVYLGGYGVECMLKALLLSAVSTSKEREIVETFRGRQGHDYNWLLKAYRRQKSPQVPADMMRHFSRVNSWSVDMRYEAGNVKENLARGFLASVHEVVAWIEGRL